MNTIKRGAGSSRTTMGQRLSYGLYFFGQGLIYTLVSQYLR